jgi:site-specific DNA-methyltransferase (adenine-specific)
MKLIHGDCLELMKDIPDNSIDMILTDPPFGTTACKWDNIIPFEPMWNELKRITKDNGAICLFGQNPFTASLIMSNPKMYRYDWIWKKNRVTGHAHCNKMPMKNSEFVSVFYSRLPNYRPQGLIDCSINQKRKSKEYSGLVNSKMKGGIQKKTNYPKTILEGFGAVFKTIHPNQKPVALLEYLIKTYTLENETVLDFTMGSGSTGVACKNLNRNFIGIELEEKYFNIAKERIEKIQD